MEIRVGGVSFFIAHAVSNEQTLDEFAEKIDIDGFGYVSIEAGGFRSNAKVCLLVGGYGT